MQGERLFSHRLGEDGDAVTMAQEHSCQIQRERCDTIRRIWRKFSTDQTYMQRSQRHLPIAETIRFLASRPLWSQLFWELTTRHERSSQVSAYRDSAIIAQCEAPPFPKESLCGRSPDVLFDLEFVEDILLYL